MATLPEEATYDEGVYQLEASDPVQGGVDGVSNLPLKNLANRTAYLKEHLGALQSGMDGKAPINSPTFTGDPKAPTPALGDNDTSIATTAFVQATARGVLSKSVAGGSNVTLSAAEAGNAILILTGALEDDIAVILPNSGRWLIVNATSGDYELTIKTAGGSGVTVAQEKSRDVYGDGTDIKYVDTDPTGLVDSALGNYYSKAEVDSALSGKVSKSGDTMTGKLGVKSVDATVSALGNVSGTKSIDVSSASTFTMTITGNATLSFTNAPGSGRDQVVYLKITNGGAYTINWPTGTLFAGGEAPELTASGTDLVAIWYDVAQTKWVVGVIFEDYQ